MKRTFQYSIYLVLLFGIAACSQSKKVENRDDSGALLESYEINNDSLRHGIYKGYFDDGTVRETASYSAGKLNGDRKIFYKNGQVEIHEKYDEDIIHGPYIVYHENGKLKLVVNFVDGVMEGPLKAFYPDGTLKEEVMMADNNENGPFKEFHANGKLKWEGQYLNGDNEFGLLKEYNEAGELIRKMECDSLGVCITIWTKEDGDIRQE